MKHKQNINENTIPTLRYARHPTHFYSISIRVFWELFGVSVLCAVVARKLTGPSNEMRALDQAIIRTGAVTSIVAAILAIIINWNCVKSYPIVVSGVLVFCLGLLMLQALD